MSEYSCSILSNPGYSDCLLNAGVSIPGKCVCKDQLHVDTANTSLSFIECDFNEGLDKETGTSETMLLQPHKDPEGMHDV